MGKTLEECYEILGLEYGAKEDEIKSAYRKKALMCHPDKNPDDPLSTQKFQELGHAYRRLTGEEDSDDNDYEDDDMDLWRDFFFFLFRDEILARVRCKCSRCGRAGEQEDDDFLASLAKEQEEQYRFTEEEMAQFTCFANLKEQREANKKKFCDERNQSNIKPEQKATKGHKPKLKSNKQLKVEQWKREKEISEMTAQISQTNPMCQEKKASKEAKSKELHQQKSCNQHGVADRRKDVKQPTESSVNKRNARKRKNRNRSKQHGDKETEFGQNNGFAKTTLAEQKLASSFAVQDSVRNITIKPETTKRQDDVTGRLPRYTRYTSPRMMKAQAHVQDSTMNRQKNVPPKQTARGWFDNQNPGTVPRPSYGANIWQKRQEKQQFLAELQPSNQTDEELQLQLALELSKKQAEIDAQQREINILERQMEETLQTEKQFQKTSSMEETHNTAAAAAAAAVTDPGRFATAGIPQGCWPAANEVEEWGVASDREDEWQESEQVSNFSDEDASNDEENGFKIDEASEPLHETDYHDLDEEHPAERYVSSGKISLTVPKSKEQLPQPSRSQDSQDCCPYGKNCCLGKGCMYLHPPSIDNRKSQNVVDNTSTSTEKCDSSSTERVDVACSPTEKHFLPVTSFEEAPDASDLSYPVDKPGQSSTISNHKDTSTTNGSLYPLQPGLSVGQVPESEDEYSTEQSVYAGDSVTFGHMGGAGSTGLGEDSNQLNPSSGKLVDFPPSSWDIKTDPESFIEDRPLSSQEKSKSTNASDVQIHSSGHLDDINVDPGRGDSDGLTVVCENPVTEEASKANSDVKSPTVYVIADQSQFPLGFPAASVLKHSVPALPSLVNLSAGPKLQKFPQSSQSSTCFPVNYTGQMPTGLPVNLTAQTLTAVPQSSRPVATTPLPFSSASQNSASSSPSETLETSATTQQPITAVSSTSSQAGVTNGFQAVAGFPFFPFGNVFPFLNPANAAANASLMAAAAAGQIPFPVMPGTTNSMPSQQGGQFVPPYLNTDIGGRMSPLGQFLPMQAQLNGLPGMTMEGNVPVPRPPPPQPQPSKTGVANNPRSAAPTMQQPFRFPIPFIDPQAFVNMNAAMALGIPYPLLQNGCQTGLQSGMTPQLQANNKTTDPGKVLHTGAGTTKPVAVKPDLGLERGDSVSCGSKTPSLRRPATVPKVIQHQASKSS